MAEAIQGADELKARLRHLKDDLLPALYAPLVSVRNAIASEAASSVPVDQGELSGSAFTDGPVTNKRAQSATTTTGYTSKHAAYEHEGFHFGRRTVPPKWLERAASGKEHDLAQKVAAALRGALARLGK